MKRIAIRFPSALLGPRAVICRAVEAALAARAMFCRKCRYHQREPMHAKAIAWSGAAVAMVAAVGAVIAIDLTGGPRLTAVPPRPVSTVVWWDGLVSDGTDAVRATAPAPGEHGVAVLAGHVSSTAGPGALYKLSELTTGDAITITGSNGRSSRWMVSAPPQTVLKNSLPPALWVTSGPPNWPWLPAAGRSTRPSATTSITSSSGQARPGA